MNTNNNNEQIFYNAKTNLERAGFEVETISIANASFTANENHTKYTAEISLPQGKTLEDYCSVLLWSVVEDDTGYASLPSSANVVADDENNISGNQTVKLYKLNQKNYIEFYMSNEAMSKDYLESMITNWTELMLISTPLRVFNQTNTVITYSLADFFTLERLGFDFSDKSYLITLDYQSDEEIECYSLTPREPTSSGDTIINDGDNYYTESSDISAEHHKDYFKFKILRVEQFGVVGYTQEELDSMTEAEKDNIAKFNAAALNKASDFCAKMAKKFLRIMNLSFKPNRIYLLGSVVYFSSDTNFLGNNAVIKLFKNTNNVADVIVAFSNKKIVNIDDDYGNVGFYDLIIEGRYGNSVSIADQAIKCNGDSSKTIPKNVTFVNVTAKDFAFGIHINNSTYYNIPLYWTFINCDFKTGMGFNLTGVRNLKLLNSHIDNCLSSGKGNHCIYISEKCSYITVDHCLLENSTGGAIHQMFGHSLYDSTFNEHNTYKNLTISSCFTAIHIGPASRDTVVENVVVVDAWRIIMLESCIDTKIRNVKATGVFYDKMLDRKSHEWKDPDERSTAKWFFIRIKGMADADIEDCNFKFSSPFFDCSAYSNEIIKSEDTDPSYSNIAPEAIRVFENQEAWFEERTSTDGEKFYLVTPSVRFKNCQFDTTHNPNGYTNVLGYQANQAREKGKNEAQAVYDEDMRQAATNTFLIVDNNEIKAKVAYKLKLDFTNCKFNFNFYTKSAPYFRSVGNTASALQSQSEYSFKNCNIAYFIESPNQSNVPSGYFMQAQVGSSVTISNCAFYKNRGNENAHNYLECKEGAYATSENNILKVYNF